MDIQNTRSYAIKEFIANNQKRLVVVTAIIAVVSLLFGCLALSNVGAFQNMGTTGATLLMTLGTLPLLLTLFENYYHNNTERGFISFYSDRHFPIEEEGISADASARLQGLVAILNNSDNDGRNYETEKKQNLKWLYYRVKDGERYTNTIFNASYIFTKDLYTRRINVRLDLAKGSSKR